MKEKKNHNSSLIILQHIQFLTKFAMLSKFICKKKKKRIKIPHKNQMFMGNVSNAEKSPIVKAVRSPMALTLETRIIQV